VRDAGPKGVGLSVGLLWGVSVQLVAQGFSRLASSTVFASGGGGRVLAAVAAFAGASLAFVFGELVRRGVGRTRRLVVVLGVALTVAGVASLPGTARDIGHGFYWSAVPTAILVTIAPLMALWMHSTRSRHWFDSVTSDVARRRHGGVWVVTLAVVALGSGLLVAYAEAR
jgi:heme exporter protein D